MGIVKESLFLEVNL